MTQATKLEIKAKSKVLEGLNKEQIEAVTHSEGPLLIVAGAGTGKTTVITRRIAYLIEQGAKPEEILAMAFGEKAALEMEERVDQLLPYGYYNLQISTFHSFGEKLLKEYGLEVGLPDFKVLDEVGQWLLVRNNLEKFELDYYRPLGNPTKFIKAFVSHFGRCKDELITPDEYLEYAEKLKLISSSAEAGVETADEEIKRVEEVANAYHVYQKFLLESSFLDFGDLINYSLKILKDRPPILEKLRKRYKYILIDEFQDTNYAQYQLIKLLSTPHNNITVVGDDDQSIFKFRGASISNIMHFKGDYPNTKFISLTRNYRSGQKILDLAYQFIKQNDPDRLESKLAIDKKLESNLREKGVVATFVAEDYASEASLVADKIVELKDKNSDLTWNDFAILARSHDALDPFINMLDRRGLPYIYFANRGVYHKSIILDSIAYLRLLDDYHESASLYRVLSLPTMGLASNAIIELAHYAKKKALSLYEAAKQAVNIPRLLPDDINGIHKLLINLEKHAKLAREKNALEVFINIVSDLEFEKLVKTDTPQGLQNAKYLESFVKKLEAFQNDNPDKTLKNFMRQLNFEIEAGSHGDLEFDAEAGPEAVKLMTAHGAKGLEFAYVFVVSLVDKRFPSIERREQIEIPNALVKDIIPEGDIHLQEERRLFYVSMTRAQYGLYFTLAFDYGGKLTKKPSRFLIELGFAESEKAKPTGEVELKRPVRIVLPVPKSFSFSQISTFKKCPLEYKYRYVFGLPTAGSASASFGQSIHSTFEKFVRYVKQHQNSTDLFGANKAALPKFEFLEKFYRESWIDDWYPSKSNKQEYWEKGRGILKFFYEETTLRPPKPKYVEEWFRMKLDGNIFVGKIDRAEETPDGLVIIDYKTGARRKIDKVEKEQLLIYQWAAEDFFKEKVADLQYWFLENGLEKVSFVGEKKDVENLKTDLLETINAIIQACKKDSFAQVDRQTAHRGGNCEYRRLES